MALNTVLQFPPTPIGGEVFLLDRKGIAFAAAVDGVGKFKGAGKIGNRRRRRRHCHSNH